jgi:hypothetical protein
MLPFLMEVTMERQRLQHCPCGSGEYPEPQYDGYGIFLCYTCPKCAAGRLKGYRADIFERYDADEPIEEE